MGSTVRLTVPCVRPVVLSVRPYGSPFVIRIDADVEICHGSS